MTETYLYERKVNNSTDYNVWFAFPECYSFSLSSLGFLWINKEFDENEIVAIANTIFRTNSIRNAEEKVIELGL